MRMFSSAVDVAGRLPGSAAASGSLHRIGLAAWTVVGEDAASLIGAV
jgi:hypothetical protein